MKTETMRFLVTKEQVEEARRRLAVAGYPMPDAAGEVQKKGVTLRYSLSPVRDGVSVLRLELVDKPWYVSADYLRKRVREMTTAAGVSEIETEKEG